MKRGGNIGRLLIIEIADNEKDVFDHIMQVLNEHPNFQRYEVQNMAELVFPGLEIYSNKRKVYRNGQEIHLTAKEYDLLCLLATNKGQVLTYDQIYDRVWGEALLKGGSTVIGYHICNLRGKLFSGLSDTPCAIKCVREVGYCFEVNL